jgi:small subunit ribosomal protein S20
MPHLKSAEKRLRQNIKRREKNRAVKKVIRKQLKAVLEVSEDKQGTVEKLQEAATLAFKKLDKAAARGTIHRNMAARKKSQIARLLKAKAAPAPAK